MKIVESLKWRYATKKFDPNKKLTPIQVDGILQVLNLTPTSYGLQPLKFLRIVNPEIREELVSASWNQRQVTDASDLIVICIENRFTEEDVDQFINRTASKRNEDAKTPRYDSFKKMLMKIVDWSNQP